MNDEPCEVCGLRMVHAFGCPKESSPPPKVDHEAITETGFPPPDPEPQRRGADSLRAFGKAIGVDVDKAFHDTCATLERRAACPGHQLVRVDPNNVLRGWLCTQCKARISNGEAKLYRQGINHGKQFGADCTCNPLEQTGGRHAANCPERKNEGPEPRQW